MPCVALHWILRQEEQEVAIKDVPGKLAKWNPEWKMLYEW